MRHLKSQAIHHFTAGSRHLYAPTANRSHGESFPFDNWGSDKCADFFSYHGFWRKKVLDSREEGRGGAEFGIGTALLIVNVVEWWIEAEWQKQMMIQYILVDDHDDPKQLFCGMLWVLGLEEDDAQHVKVCKEYKEGVSFLGWKSVKRVGTFF